MAKTFHVKLITPTAKVLDDDVTYASVPAWDGLFGVLPGRAPLVAKLGLGELKLDFPDQSGARGGSRSFLVEDGFVQMINNNLTILATRAIATESISASDAEAELREVQSRRTPDDARGADKLRKDRARAALKLRLARGGAI